MLVRNEDEFDLWYYPLLRPWLDFVPVRFVLFSLSSIVLIVMAVRNLLALMV